jgi:hypothetical protein
MPNQCTIIFLGSRGVRPCQSVGQLRHMLLIVAVLSRPVQVDIRGPISWMLLRGEMMLPFTVCLTVLSDHITW